MIGSAGKGTVPRIVDDFVGRVVVTIGEASLEEGAVEGGRAGNAEGGTGSNVPTDV